MLALVQSFRLRPVNTDTLNTFVSLYKAYLRPVNNYTYTVPGGGQAGVNMFATRM